MNLEQYRLKTNLQGGGNSDWYRIPYQVQSGDTVNSLQGKFGGSNGVIGKGLGDTLNPGETVYVEYSPSNINQVPTGLIHGGAPVLPRAQIEAGANAPQDVHNYAGTSLDPNKAGSGVPVPQLGTPEYTNYLVQQGQNLGLNLGQYKIPTSASGVTQTGSLQLPSGTSSAGNIAGATAGTKGMSEYLSTQMAAIEQQRKSIESQQTQQQSWLKDFLSSSSTAAQTRSQAETAAGMESTQFFADQKARVAEIESLTNNYNAIVASRDQQIATSYDALGSTSFINNRIAQINRNAAPELSRLSANVNAKAATLQALQGNFDRAQNYIDQAVQDATADKKDKLDAFATFYKMNQDTLSRLDTQYQQAFSTAYDLAKMQYQNDLDLKKTLADLQLKNPQVSLNLSGTLDAAVSAIRSNPAANKGDIFGSATTGYFERYLDPKTNTYKTRTLTGGDGNGGNVSGGSFIDVMQKAIDQGATAQEAAREAAAVSEGAGIPVDQKTLNSWTNTAKGLNKTPATTTAPEAPSEVNNAINRIYSQNPNLRSGVNVTSQVRNKLKSQGFTDSQIANSSIGSGLDRAISGVTSFFGNLFGSVNK